MPGLLRISWAKSATSPAGDPRRPQVGVDLARAQVGGLHRGQGVDVDLPSAVGGRRFGGDGQFGPHVARQVGGGGDQAPVGGVVEDQLAEPCAGVGGVDAEQRGDVVHVGPALLVEADRQGLFGGVGPEAAMAGLEDAALEDGGLGSMAGVGVEHLQRQHRGQVGVMGEAAHSWRHPPVGRLAGVGVVASGGGQGETVQRPIAVEIVVVRVIEAAPGRLPGGVVDRRGLGVEDLVQCVAHHDGGPQLSRPVLRVGLEADRHPVLHPGEHAGGGDQQAALFVMGGAHGGPADRDHFATHRPRGGRQPGGPGGVGHVGQDPRQVAFERFGAGSHGEVVVVVLAVVAAELAEHPVGAGREHFVDGGRPVGGGHLDAALPGDTTLAGVAGRAAAQDDQVDDDVGARHLAEGPRGEAERADKVGQFRPSPGAPPGFGRRG